MNRKFSVSQKMDSFGKIVWKEYTRKAADLGVIDMMQFACDTVTPLTEKTLRRRLNDHRLWLMNELEDFQNFCQSKILENAICERFKVRKEASSNKTGGVL